MTRVEILEDIKIRFKDDIVNIFDRSADRSYIDIKPMALKRVVEYVFRHLKARFNTASGVDSLGHMEILYHFTFEAVDLVVSFRVKLDMRDLEIESITPLFEGANWI